VCVSVFVNPLQFDDPSDFARYHRDLASDTAFAVAHGASFVFAPTADTMLGTEPVAITVDPGPMGEILEGRARSGHFRGVATIVTKLFALAWPDAAYFGEKDFQQLAIVRAVAHGLSFPVEIVACPTVREPDGLALSSRNARLDPAARAAAPVLYAALVAGRDCLSRGASPAEAEGSMADCVRAEPRISLDYAVCRDAATLGPPDDPGRPRRLLIAGSVGGVRLIDNLDAGPDRASRAVEYPSSVPTPPGSRS
jgi:pantoate--beta-alanine ligase